MKRAKLGLVRQLPPPWSAEELAKLRTAEGRGDLLSVGHTRQVIAHKKHMLKRSEARRAERVRRLEEHLAAIRSEVAKVARAPWLQEEMFSAVLVMMRDGEEIQGAVRQAYTDVFGRKHISLDAAIGDEGSRSLLDALPASAALWSGGADE
ncbi:hypothetical protein JNW90_28640 [Micromonospora sp. STR1s_5]|nr:hypothetical protein [Micromonospora sp. STR1s_5]